MTQIAETGVPPRSLEWPQQRAGVRLPDAVLRLGTEIAKFASVGAIAFVIDVGLFNLLRTDLLAESPLTAKTISVLVATLFAYMANRHWTYRHRPRTGMRRESLLFLATNGIALLISWACLATTHYLLGMDSQLADNISGNGIAVALATLFRFYVYRTIVFPESSSNPEPAGSAEPTSLPEPSLLEPSLVPGASLVPGSTISSTTASEADPSAERALSQPDDPLDSLDFDVRVDAEVVSRA